MTSLLTANQVAARYGKDGPAVLGGLSLSVEPGVWLGVVGPNGSGKSTLVRVLSRGLRPEAGAVRLGGKDLYREVTPRHSAQSIAVVPQSAAPSLDFTVREIVEMGRFPFEPGAGAGVAGCNAVSDALDAAGCATLSDRRSAALSGGEWQRVLLARALAQQTPIMLLDEPTAHVDIGNQRPLLDLVRVEVRERGKAVLSVLHDLNLAAEYCDRLVLIANGRAAAVGTPAETLTAANLSAVYGTRVWVRRHPAGDRPLVLTLPDYAAGSTAVGPRIQVLCGGGTGAGLLVALTERGYRLGAGALNVGDTDQEIADLLGIAYAAESPFTPLSARAVAEAAERTVGADAVLVTDIPYGPANVALLGLAEQAMAAGVPVALLEPPTQKMVDRDFTGGVAAAKRDLLASAGAVSLPDQQAVLAWLENTTRN
jgi:iron complex transport system ATP-binding protein